MRDRERSRSPRHRPAPIQLLRLLLDNVLIAERLVTMLDLPTRCSLLLVAKREHAQFVGSLGLIFQEYCGVVVRIFKQFPISRNSPRQQGCLCRAPNRPTASTSRNGFLAELCVFYGYPELALLFLGNQRLPDRQWGAVIAVVMNRPQIFTESRLWLGGLPFRSNIVELARGMDREFLIPLLPAAAQASPNWHRCTAKAQDRFHGVPSQLVQCIQLLCSLGN